jgi:transposase
VDLDIAGQQVTVKVDAGPGPFPCPECQALIPGYDRRLRRWRHLDTCQFVTWIEAGIPRVECPRHGVKQIPVPWAEAGSQFTALFERLAIGRQAATATRSSTAWSTMRRSSASRGRATDDGSPRPAGNHHPHRPPDDVSPNSRAFTCSTTTAAAAAEDGKKAARNSVEC